MVLVGCQHPLAPSIAGRDKEAVQFPAPVAGAQDCLLDFLDLAVPESAAPQDQSPVASVQKEPECLTGELADGVMQVFKVFTGH